MDGNKPWKAPLLTEGPQQVGEMSWQTLHDNQQEMYEVLHLG